jgi:Fe-S-cluster containining protein
MQELAAKDGPSARTVYALSIHADYHCHRSGVCCTSDWDVPVELPLYRSLSQALAAGDVRPAAEPHNGDPVLMTGDDLPDDAAAMVARTSSGDCVFYHRGSGLCVIHRDAGEAQLPATCRHFPRLAVRDGRGTSITLTHYCPTAAAMLFRDDVALEIVKAPPAFPPAEYEGLVITPEDWPPLLHPRMLMDLSGYAAWERHMVACCAREGISPESVVATLDRDARQLRRYSRGIVSLADAVAALPCTNVPADPHRVLDGSLATYTDVLKAVPADMMPEPDESGLDLAYANGVADSWDQFRVPLTRFLATKAFASWTAYQGRGVLTIVRGLEAALGLVRVEAARQVRNAGRALDAELLREAFRQADFLLNHLAAGDELAEGWSRVEE